MTALRVGVDENGLGAKLGPLIVTAVMAEISPEGERFLTRRPRGKLGLDLNDSKALVAHGRIELAEAWARVLGDEHACTPAELFSRLTRRRLESLQQHCPKAAVAQCWSITHDAFEAPLVLMQRLTRHKATLEAKGIAIQAVRTEVVCVDQLNRERERGLNRFLSDLHAMERLVLDLRERAGRDLTAVCGKVGGMHDYARYFGPLAGRLHVALEQSRPRSAYHFPGIGQLRFVQDADASDALVMLASLVGKYVRELLMGRIWHYYAHTGARSEPTPNARRKGTEPEAPQSVSGYNDPITHAFIDETRLVRTKRGIPDSCFQRTQVGDS